ncbi:MAG: prepilin-type N-terminal cleavage/methylation domain-containing protein [Coleofasciculus sp. C1-SOL-03]|uniref:pilus assembly FimT family protein n=1 Tax=Coleofasciculus sp. C1-SOL-03 TaxID=3069522 RepID=UPI0032F4D4A3
MNKSTLLKKYTKLATRQTQQSWREDSTKGEAGFSLLELVVVVLMIAILSAIAAPGWLAFVNRQRVSKVNDQVWSALQEAQREAKRTQLSYSVSFRQSAGERPQVAVYPTQDRSGDDIDLDNNSNAWRPLTEGLDIKPEQVTLCSNIDSNKDNEQAAFNCNLDTERTIIFDYQGNLALVDGEEPDIGDGINITVAVPQSNGDPIEATARCVVVKTLIGSMQIGKNSQDCQFQ